jgi:predicted RNA-binding protein YlqC (UPF0109 family)
MKELLKTLVTPLVDHPEDIEIREIRRGQQTILKLTVAPEDMGRVIGKGGRRATAIRAVVKAKASVERRRVLIDIGE